MTATAPPPKMMPRMAAFWRFMSAPLPPAPRTTSGARYYPIFVYDVWEEVWYWDTSLMLWVVYYLPVNPVYCLEMFSANDLVALFPTYQSVIGEDYPLAYPSNKLVPWVYFSNGSQFTPWINAGVLANNFAVYPDYNYAWQITYNDITAQMTGGAAPA